jgi:hypothetical protein
LPIPKPAIFNVKDCKTAPSELSSDTSSGIVGIWEAGSLGSEIEFFQFTTEMD